jgi:hypothetical protein
METSLAEKLAYFLKIKGLNERQASIKYAISNGLIGRALKGKNELSLKNIQKIIEKEPDLNLNWLFKGEDPIFRNNATPCMDLQMVSEPTSHYIVEPGSTFISFINLFAFLMSSGPGVDQPKTIYQGEASHIIEWEPLTRYLMVSNLQINNNRLGIFVSNLGIHLAYQASTDATTTIIITEKGQEVLLNTPLITSKWLVLGQLHQSTNGQLPDAEILAKINAAKKI